MLEAVDAAGIALFQRRPQRRIGAAQVAETAERARRGAVDEDQDGKAHRVGQRAAVAEDGRPQRGAGAVGAAPAIEAGAGVGQPAFDGHHQRLGAGPADAEFDRARQPRRQFQHRVGAADDQRADPAQQPAGRLAEQAARLCAFDPQLFQQHRAVRSQQGRPADPQRRLQAGRAADEDAAVGQLQHHHFVGAGIVPLLGGAIGQAAPRASASTSQVSQASDRQAGTGRPARRRASPGSAATAARRRSRGRTMPAAPVPAGRGW